jgi:hypothetical protein
MRMIRWLDRTPTRHRARNDAERLMKALAQGLGNGTARQARLQFDAAKHGHGSGKSVVPIAISFVLFDAYEPKCLGVSDTPKPYDEGHALIEANLRQRRARTKLPLKPR